MPAYNCLSVVHQRHALPANNNTTVDQALAGSMYVLKSEINIKLGRTILGATLEHHCDRLTCQKAPLGVPAHVHRAISQSVPDVIHKICQ